MRRLGLSHEHAFNATTSPISGAMRSVAPVQRSMMTRVSRATIVVLILFALYLQIIYTAYSTLTTVKHAGGGEVHDLHTVFRHRKMEVHGVAQQQLLDPGQQSLPRSIAVNDIQHNQVNNNANTAVAATAIHVDNIVHVVYSR